MTAAVARETSFSRASLALTKRWLWRLRREPMGIIAALIQPAIWLILFGNLFQNGVAGAEGNYIAFMTAGVVVMTVFNGSMSGGVEILFDRESKMFERLVAAPIPPLAVMTSRFGFVLGLTAIQSTIIFLVSAALGVETASGIGGYLLIVLTGMLLGVGILGLSTALAFGLSNHGPFFAISSFISLPLIFASNALAPIENMPGWLQTVARLNPMSYAISNVRELMLEGYNWPVLGTTVAVLLAFDAVMLTICLWTMRRALS
ncbi:MAG: ABC transporter permease [Chloroflexia bacterium]|nr:ABC transporter permease [Chloroflexia bacterium]